MAYYNLVASQFQSHIEHLSLSVDAIADILTTAANESTETIFAERKLFACGVAVDCPSAMVLAELLRVGLERERPPLPVIELCPRYAEPVSGATRWLAQQLTALGQPGDLAIVFASSLGADHLEIISTALTKRRVKSIWIGGQGCGPSLLFPDADHATTLSLSHSAAICLAGLIDISAFGPLEE